MNNLPLVKLGICAMSRDCFKASLSSKRLEAVASELTKRNIGAYVAKTIVENETDAMNALAELKDNDVNALVIYLGNFGPEGPETMLAQKFGLPVMFVAAAEENSDNLVEGRGDAYCGMLNASYNLGLRGVRAYIPEYPVGDAVDVASMIDEFIDVARCLLALKGLKIFSFGPRPFDFLACNAPIKPLYDIGVEIQENSELDLFESYNKHSDDPRIPGLVAEIEEELGTGNKHSGVLVKVAQYELTLLDWAKKHKGASDYFAFANKCWPAFQTQFGFVPCYINSRLTQRGIPVACETDIYGALSEFIITAATCIAPTLLDMNNTVPKDMYAANTSLVKGYSQNDLFMGFHCGNTPICHLKRGEMRYQLLMKRILEPDGEPNISRGTLEGYLNSGEITLFRLQSNAEGVLKSYIAEGEILDVDPKTFGGVGVIAIAEMGRFYRHVLIEKRFPHHAGVAFKRAGKTLFDVMKLLGIQDISFNQPKGMLYRSENPFA